MTARVEHKYLFNNQDENQVVNHFASRGYFLEKQAAYRVSSVYYDSPDFSCAQKNLLGLTPREKYRYRAYGPTDSGVNVVSASGFFEQKKKIASHVYKTRIPMEFAEPLEVCSLLLQKQIGSDSLYREVTDRYPDMLNFSPVLLVSYLRSRYRLLHSNTEITIDSGLSYINAMNLNHTVCRDDIVVVEHKYHQDEAFSLAIAFDRPRTRFSKYLYGLHQAGLLYEY